METLRLFLHKAALPKKIMEKPCLHFRQYSVYWAVNRVGDPASSATGTGSLPGGRRTFPRWDHRTRCCIWDILLYVATILGRAMGKISAAYSPRVIQRLYSSPAVFRRGLCVFWSRRGSCRLLLQKKEAFLCKKFKKAQPCIPIPSPRRIGATLPWN